MLQLDTAVLWLTNAFLFPFSKHKHDGKERFLRQQRPAVFCFWRLVPRHHLLVYKGVRRRVVVVMACCSWRVMRARAGVRALTAVHSCAATLSSPT